MSFSAEIVYTLISVQDLPLAEFSKYAGTFAQYGQRLYEYIDSSSRYGSIGFGGTGFETGASPPGGSSSVPPIGAAADDWGAGGGAAAAGAANDALAAQQQQHQQQERAAAATAALAAAGRDSGQWLFHYLNMSGLTFLCLAHRNVSQDSAFSYLNELFMHFFTVFRDLDLRADEDPARVLQTFLPFELNALVAPVIRKLTEKYLTYVIDGTQLPVSVDAAGRAPVELDEREFRRRLKAPLLVTTSRLARAGDHALVDQKREEPSFLDRHPYLLIGLFSFFAVILFVYILVSILCGSVLERCIHYDLSPFHNKTVTAMVAGLWRR